MSKIIYRFYPLPAKMRASLPAEDVHEYCGQTPGGKNKWQYLYNHRAIETKWRENWEKHPVNVDDGKKEKYYCLDMFPYPSGNGLHVGHWRGYVISDVWSRYKMLNGYYLIHPMGWDAFGLPAENYAIKMGVHPAKSTAENVSNIKKQINDIAAIYDWDMEVNTTDPEFYKWTQWIFCENVQGRPGIRKRISDQLVSVL